MTQTVSAPLRVAVITGEHAFDVPAFQELLWELRGATCYPQSLDNLAADVAGALAGYDAFLLYNMHRATPEGRALEALTRIVEGARGIVALHHALLAFPSWQPWAHVVGLPERTTFTYDHDQTLRLEIVRPEHPVTRGLAAWEMVDETYGMAGADEGGPSPSDVLLTTAHPRSMRSIAWARQPAAARVFCLALGHDALAYGNPSFRALLAQGLHWAAGR